jgi:hypothetical protein
MPPDGEVTISPFPVRIVPSRKAAISPALLPTSKQSSIAKLLSWTLFPASRIELRQLFEHGKQAATVWSNTIYR